MHIKSLAEVNDLALALAKLEHTRKSLSSSDEPPHMELYRARLPADIAMEILPALDAAYATRIRALRRKLVSLGVTFGEQAP